MFEEERNRRERPSRSHWRKWEDSDRGMRDQSFERLRRAGRTYDSRNQEDRSYDTDRVTGNSELASDYLSAGIVQSPYGYRRGFDEYERRHEERQAQHFGKGPKGYRRSDDRILEEVCEALTRDPEVDASDIEVKVKDSIAILAGTVESRRMKRRAEECVEQCFGVEDVQNELKVSRDSKERFSKSPGWNDSSRQNDGNSKERSDQLQ